MPFEFEKLGIPDIILIKPSVFKDERGFFMEVYKKPDFEEANIKTEFIQDNHSFSKKNVLRGLHFQREPYAQAKLVRCIVGEIYDVAVDLRRKSSSFGKYIAVRLSGENNYILYVPRGFAHGFQVLSEYAHVIYKVDNLYAPKYESGLIWNDPDINIKWPTENPLISEKDKKWSTLKKLIERDELF